MTALAETCGTEASPLDAVLRLMNTDAQASTDGPSTTSLLRSYGASGLASGNTMAVTPDPGLSAEIQLPLVEASAAPGRCTLNLTTNAHPPDTPPPPPDTPPPPSPDTPRLRLIHRHRDTFPPTSRHHPRHTMARTDLSTSTSKAATKLWTETTIQLESMPRHPQRRSTLRPRCEKAGIFHCLCASTASKRTLHACTGAKNTYCVRHSANHMY